MLMKVKPIGRARPWRAFLVLSVAVLVVTSSDGCDGSVAHPSMVDALDLASTTVFDAGKDFGRPLDQGPDATDREGGSCDLAPVISVAADASTSDAEPRLPANLVAPSPPVVCCDADAAAPCDLPPSQCATGADAGIAATEWIVYYENPRCIEGRCVWDQSYFECRNLDICSRGACLFPGTAN